VYLRRTELAEAATRRFAPLYRLLFNKYYVDEVYDATIVMPIKKRQRSCSGTSSMSVSLMERLTLQQRPRASRRKFFAGSRRVSRKVMRSSLSSAFVRYFLAVRALIRFRITDFRLCSHTFSSHRFLGILLLALAPKAKESILKAIGVGSSLVTFILSIALYYGFDSSSAEMQFVEQIPWIHSLDMNYVVELTDCPSCLFC